MYVTVYCKLASDQALTHLAHLINYFRSSKWLRTHACEIEGHM